MNENESGDKVKYIRLLPLSLSLSLSLFYLSLSYSLSSASSVSLSPAFYLSLSYSLSSASSVSLSLLPLSICLILTRSLSLPPSLSLLPSLRQLHRRTVSFSHALFLSPPPSLSVSFWLSPSLPPSLSLFFPLSVCHSAALHLAKLHSLSSALTPREDCDRLGYPLLATLTAPARLRPLIKAQTPSAVRGP